MIERKRLNRKGNMVTLNNIAYALLTFGILIGLGMIMLTKFGDQVVTCPGGTVSGAVKNETGHVNGSGYTLAQSTRYGFVPTLTQLMNYSSGDSIVLANATVSNGVVKNATAVNWGAVNISYTYTYDNTHTWNSTSQSCYNPVGADELAGSGGSYTAIAYTITQLSSSGLAGWLPVVIVVVVAALVLAYFGGRKKSY